jgi:hypothetical protein
MEIYEKQKIIVSRAREKNKKIYSGKVSNQIIAVLL